MSLTFNHNFPSVDDLIKKAKKKIPKFAFEYLDGGCNNDINIKKNTDEIRQIELIPRYINKFSSSSLKTELFGHEYDAPFGISPVGLQGLMWPKSPEILAKASLQHNIPFILSTVTTSSIEKIGEISEGKAWFQLYNPAEDSLRDDILKRLESSGYSVLVILCDVPSFGYRPRDIRNGLAMPPRMTIRNIIEILKKPNWAMQTLWHGKPQFEVLKPYMPKNLDMKQLGKFMNDTFSGRLNEEKISLIRDKWKGKLVLKGVANEQDVETAIKLGLDGVIVSNHGGRQLDVGESTIKPMIRIAKNYSDKIKVMMDSGMRSGPDIANCLAAGAEFTFMGRSFMYGVSALGKEGGNHTIAILKMQLQQVLEQLGCEKVKDLSNYLKKSF